MWSNFSSEVLSFPSSLFCRFYVLGSIRWWWKYNFELEKHRSTEKIEKFYSYPSEPFFLWTWTQYIAVVCFMNLLLAWPRLWPPHHFYKLSFTTPRINAICCPIETERVECGWISSKSRAKEMNDFDVHFPYIRKKYYFVLNGKHTEWVSEMRGNEMIRASWKDENE